MVNDLIQICRLTHVQETSIMMYVLREFASTQIVCGLWYIKAHDIAREDATKFNDVVGCRHVTHVLWCYQFGMIW